MSGLQNFIGFLLPPLIDLINRKVPSSDARFWVSVASCVVLAIPIAYFDGSQPGFGIDEVLTGALVLLGQSQITYKLVYEDSRLQSVMRDIKK